MLLDKTLKTSIIFKYLTNLFEGTNFSEEQILIIANTLAKTDFNIMISKTREEFEKIVLREGLNEDRNYTYTIDGVEKPAKVVSFSKLSFSIEDECTFFREDGTLVTNDATFVMSGQQKFSSIILLDGLKTCKTTIEPFKLNVFIDKLPKKYMIDLNSNNLLEYLVKMTIEKEFDLKSANLEMFSISYCELKDGTKFNYYYVEGNSTTVESENYNFLKENVDKFSRVFRDQYPLYIILDSNGKYMLRFIDPSFYMDPDFDKNIEKLLNDFEGPGYTKKDILCLCI